jgi:hypothetical protein
MPRVDILPVMNCFLMRTRNRHRTIAAIELCGANVGAQNA